MNDVIRARGGGVVIGQEKAAAATVDLADLQVT